MTRGNGDPTANRRNQDIESLKLAAENVLTPLSSQAVK
jgi:hypothetical protein